MDFLKKHYEKLTLGIVLIVVMFLALQIPSEISKAKREEEQRKIELQNRATNSVEAIDLAAMETAIEELKKATPTRFNQPGQNIFNPVKWKRGAKGDKIKIPTPQDAINDLVIREIKPLSLTVLFENEMSNDRLAITITDESLTPRIRRRPQTRNPRVREGESNDIFKLLSMSGPEGKPTAVKIEMRKGLRQFDLKRGEPFTEVVAHEVDLDYPPEDKKFNDIAVGGTLSFNDDRYKVIAITDSAITIEGQSTPKRYTIQAAANNP